MVETYKCCEVYAFSAHVAFCVCVCVCVYVCVSVCVYVCVSSSPYLQRCN